MYVVVTGAAGFIGRHVVARLLAAGEHVVGIDRRAWDPAFGETALIADLAVPDRRVDEALAGCRGVIHLAGRPGVRDRAIDIAASRHRDNVLAGARVLEVTPMKTPVVVASSSSVYGGAGDPAAPHPCAEDAPLRPYGGYARSKLDLEDRCHARSRRGGRVSIARPFTVAGEGQRADMALARWIAAIREGRTVRIFGDASRRRDVTDVRDVAEGFARLLELPDDAVVNLGTGVTHRLDELVGAVAAALGAEPAIHVTPAGPHEVAATRADTRRCQRLLGMTPTTDLAALVTRQLAAIPTDRAATVPVAARDAAPVASR